MWQRESKQSPVADVIRCAGSRFKTSSRAQIYSKRLILYVLRDRVEREKERARERKTRRAIKILIKESVTDGRLAERYETRENFTVRQCRSVLHMLIKSAAEVLYLHGGHYRAARIVPYFCISHRDTSVNPAHTLLHFSCSSSLCLLLETLFKDLVYSTSLFVWETISLNKTKLFNRTILLIERVN